jgi:hypothetical protein
MGMKDAFPEEIKSGAFIHTGCQSFNFVVKTLGQTLTPFLSEACMDGT